MVITIPLFFGLFMRIVIKILVLLLLIAAVVGAMLFSLENAQLVSVNFFLFQLELPVSLWLLFAVLGGFILGLLASSGLFFRLIVERRKIKRVEANQKKLAKL